MLLVVLTWGADAALDNKLPIAMGILNTRVVCEAWCIGFVTSGSINKAYKSLAAGKLSQTTLTRTVDDNDDDVALVPLVYLACVPW